MNETVPQIHCDPPIFVHEGPTFTACDPNTPLPDPDGNGCPETPVILTDLGQLANAANTATAGNIPYPNAFKTIKMSNGTRRLVLNSETSLIDDCYEVEETTPINAANQNFLVNLPMGNANASLNDVLALRATGMPMSVEAPDPNQPLPGEAPISSGENGVPKFTFFIYDHLGNSRILYSNNLKDCLQDSTKYILEHVLDYYPYGKTLREYVFVREKHQSTYHERDEETGLDYRGARFYDAEVGRFLSCDPKAADYAAWSTYNYVLGNPIVFVDPDGREVTGVTNEYTVYMEGTKIVSTKMTGTKGGDEIDYVTYVDLNKAPYADGVRKEEIPVEITYTSGPGNIHRQDTHPSPGSREVHGKTHTDIAAYDFLLSWMVAGVGGTLSTTLAFAAGGGTKIPNNQLNSYPKKRGNAPVGEDGKPVELHHREQKKDDPLDEMTKEAHRGGENFKKNHSNTGQEPSDINRKEFDKQRRAYWSKEWDNGRFDDR